MLVPDLGEFYSPYGISYKSLVVVVVVWLFVFATGSQFYSSGWLASLAAPVREERSRAPHLAN